MLTFQELQRRIGDDFFYQRHFGDDGNVVAEKQRLVREVTDTFGRAFAPGADALVAACFVPGRVEVLGKHTDYAGGRSLLAAVDRGFFCVSRQNGTRQVRLVEADDRFAPCEFELSADLKPVIGHWGNYPMTMVKRLAANFGLDAAEVAAGVDVAFGCDLPVAGGLSGSSALMIMTFFALALPNRLQEDSVFQLNIKSASDLAMFLACVENGQTFRDLSGRAGVGTFGGSEDHTQILNARRGQLSVFRFCPTRHETDVAFPGDLTLLIAHSGVKAEKTGAAMVRYNLVSKRARLAVDQYNDRFARRHRFLADIAAERSEGFDSCWPGRPQRRNWTLRVDSSSSIGRIGSSSRRPSTPSRSARTKDSVKSLMNRTDCPRRICATSFPKLTGCNGRPESWGPWPLPDLAPGLAVPPTPSSPKPWRLRCCRPGGSPT